MTQIVNPANWAGQIGIDIGSYWVYPIEDYSGWYARVRFRVGADHLLVRDFRMPGESDAVGRTIRVANAIQFNLNHPGVA